MPKVITQLDANKFYGELSAIDGRIKQLKTDANPFSIPLYVHGLKEVQRVFESVIHEATKNLPNKKTSVFNRLNIVIEEQRFHPNFVENLHTTRKDCNEARHYETDHNKKEEKHYNSCVQTIATLIYKLSGVGILNSVKNIYGANIEEESSTKIQEPYDAKIQEPIITSQNSSTKLNINSKILTIFTFLAILVLGYRYFNADPLKNQMEMAISLLKQSKYDSALTLYKPLIENKFEPDNDQIILFENAIKDHYSNLKTSSGRNIYFTFPFAQGMMRIHISSTDKISYVNQFGVKMARDFDGGDDFGQDKSLKDYAKVFKIKNINPKTNKAFGNYFYIDKLGVCKLSCEIDK